ncbi:hypothetical protein COCOBI_01-1350 [Coccomyxa sp. Obi]|nr:hypothetical protein COCOBI_01-1350 [Coccomyxa sp. Obi]
MVASVYAPAVAAERPAYFMQEFLPSIPADRSLLVGGDFNCIAGQQDMLDAAGQPGQRTQGYWTGLRHVETDYQLYDVWRDLNADGRAFTHIATLGQQPDGLEGLLLSATPGVRCHRLCGEHKEQRREWTALDHFLTRELSTQTTPAFTRRAPATHRISWTPQWISNVQPQDRSKSQGLGLGSFSHLEGPDAATGVTFVAQDASVKHLGVPLSRQPEAAATALYSAILRKVEVRIARWSGFGLSLLGRAYVAKQLLASMVTYHATFIPVPCQLEKRLCTALHTFVAATRPVLGGTSARLYPGKDTCFHAVKDEGIALVDLRAQILALQAKVVSRLLEPEQLAWKAFFDFWLYRSTAWQTAQEPRPAAHHQHIRQLGRFLPFSAFDAQRMQAPLRMRQYVYAYQKP